MAWESRIADERRRQWVLAGLMFALLAVVTTVATLANHYQQTAWKTWPSQSYRFDLPPTMDAQRSRQLTNREMGTMWVETYRSADPQRMTLHVSVLRQDQPTSLNAIWEVAYRWLAPGESFNDDRVAVEADGLESFYRVAWNHQQSDGRTPVRHGVLAVATTNQREYLLLYLTAAGEPDEKTTMLIEQILQSVRRVDRSSASVDRT